MVGSEEASIALEVPMAEGKVVTCDVADDVSVATVPELSPGPVVPASWKSGTSVPLVMSSMAPLSLERPLPLTPLAELPSTVYWEL